MSAAKLRKNPKQAFLDKHQKCYFCGGVATTIDHVPPRACFPDGYTPESFESPACKDCNQGTDKEDQIFGLYAMLLDFDESKTRQEENAKKINKLRQGIANNYPEALPDEARAYPVNRVGRIITPKAVAIAMPTPSPLKIAIEVMGKKLTHALYYRETGRILTPEHQFFSSAYQPQRRETQELTAFLTSILPDQTVGIRRNIKPYGDRFRYSSGCKAQEDFFSFAAQFGRGIILWGIVCGSGIEKPSSGPLSSASWLKRGMRTWLNCGCDFVIAHQHFTETKALPFTCDADAAALCHINKSVKVSYSEVIRHYPQQASLPPKISTLECISQCF